jgi:hypothetical protein
MLPSVHAITTMAEYSSEVYQSTHEVVFPYKIHTQTWDSTVDFGSEYNRGSTSSDCENNAISTVSFNSTGCILSD